MSDIKTGEVAFLKTTGEAVFVLQVLDETSTKRLHDNFIGEVLVRRPISGQNGITHVRDNFYAQELESLDDQRNRILTEQQELMAKYGQRKDTPNALADSGFLSN